MAQNNKPPVKSSNIKARDKKPPVYSSAKKETATLFSSLDKGLEKNSKVWLFIIFGISILFSLLLFQARMDIGGDDSGYVLRAYDFIHKGIFPSFQGPFYPLFLSIFVAFSGINVVLLKFLSIICNFVALLFLYKAFKGRIPSLVLYSVLLLTAVNSYILNFASLTYNETFYMALQYILLFYFFKLQDSLKNEKDVPLQKNWKQWLIVGLLLFLMTYTRNIAITCLMGIVIYFATQKQFRYILYLIGAFLAFEIPITLIQKLGWHSSDQWSSQGGILLLKNPYNAAEGKETPGGFIVRFIKNTDIYFSKRFFQIIGLRPSESTTTLPWVTFFFVLLLLFAMYRILKSKNKYLLAASLYVLSMAAATFIVLQTSWDQPRMIMIHVPLLLMILLYGLYDTMKKRAWALQLLSVFMIAFVFITGLGVTMKKAKENAPVLSKNFHGDIYDGFTPGWANYLKLSNWCQNLPKDSLVACRKGPMSSLYANGREFFNVAKTDNINVANADSVIYFLKKNKVRYILIGNINMGNTIERLITPVVQKYPQKLKFIKQEGSTDADPAQLYEVLY